MGSIVPKGSDNQDETSWFSDRAIAKLAECRRKRETGEEPRWSDIAGIMEPRTQPGPAERCEHCEGDARDGAGGDGHYCGLCLGRDKNDEHDYSACERPGGDA